MVKAWAIAITSGAEVELNSYSLWYNAVALLSNQSLEAMVYDVNRQARGTLKDPTVL